MFNTPIILNPEEVPRSGGGVLPLRGGQGESVFR